MENNNFIGKLRDFFSSPSYSRTLSILALLIVAAAVPLTLQNLGEQQDIRQRAVDSSGPTYDTPNGRKNVAQMKAELLAAGGNPSEINGFQNADVWRRYVSTVLGPHNSACFVFGGDYNNPGPVIAGQPAKVFITQNPARLVGGCDSDRVSAEKVPFSAGSWCTTGPFTSTFHTEWCEFIAPVGTHTISNYYGGHGEHVADYGNHLCDDAPMRSQCTFTAVARPTGTFNASCANFSGTASDADSPSSEIQIHFWLLKNRPGNEDLPRDIYLDQARAQPNYSYNPAQPNLQWVGQEKDEPTLYGQPSHFNVNRYFFVGRQRTVTSVALDIKSDGNLGSSGNVTLGERSVTCSPPAAPTATSTPVPAATATTLYFVRGTSCADSAITSLSLTVGDSSTLSLCLDANGNTIQHFRVTADISSMLNKTTITSAQQGADARGKFGTTISEDFNRTTGMMRLEKDRSDASQITNGKMDLATVSFTTTAAGNGSIGVTDAVISNPLAAVLQVSRPTLSYTISPTTTPGQPTPTPTSGGIQFGFNLKLGEIGGVNENTNPRTTARPITVEIFDRNGQLVTTKTGTVTFQSAAGNFTGTIDAGTLAEGAYTLKVKTTRYLRRLMPGFLNVTTGRTTPYVIPQASLVVGDVDGDNKIDIRDYNLIVACYQNNADTASCGSNKQLTDLNDDGKVDSVDYFVFIKGFSIKEGD